MGIGCLRHYRYEVDPDTGQFSRNPLHDHYSHGADAFSYIALMIQRHTKAQKAKATGCNGWRLDGIIPKGANMAYQDADGAKMTDQRSHQVLAVGQ
jgi:hypothetical protein